MQPCRLDNRVFQAEDGIRAIPRSRGLGDVYKRQFYEALKAVYGPSRQIQALLRSSDGSNLLTDKETIL